MDKINVGPADLQQVIQEIAQENVNLRAIKAALIRTITELEGKLATVEPEKEEVISATAEGQIEEGD